MTTKRAKHPDCSKWFPLGSQQGVKEGGDSLKQVKTRLKQEPVLFIIRCSVLCNSLQPRAFLFGEYESGKELLHVMTACTLTLWASLVAQ